MILPFSTKLEGKLTYFIERIWEGLLRFHFESDKEYVEFLKSHKIKFGFYWDWFPDEHEYLTNPKIHTIRIDQKNRWKENVDIDFFINTRQKNMFRFAPKIKVKSVQEIEIREILMTQTDFCYCTETEKIFIIEIDGKRLFKSEIEQLAKNDGFDTANDFFNYFNTDFKGKLIHWTDFKY